jgi:hypothetical protein
MYDPAVQRALMEKLGHWRRLPEGDLLEMLAPVHRLRYRSEALTDLVMDGLVTVTTVGDEPIVEITPAGDAWLQGRR